MISEVFSKKKNLPKKKKLKKKKSFDFEVLRTWAYISLNMLTRANLGLPKAAKV
jgi:hypothetical protein